MKIKTKNLQILSTELIFRVVEHFSLQEETQKYYYLIPAGTTPHNHATNAQ